LLFGDPANYPPKFASRIDAKQVEWTIDLETFLSRKNVVKVALKPLRFTEKLRALFSISSGVPPAMKSKNARRWPLDFQAILKLSEKGVPFQ
jgi:hypothetical protein